ncbi:YiiD C-terminal domain-containing protein [Psychrobium sp. 1_MG-2023]|uniref:YiiD C-terminal domain-containing protein n=1 Tax=Psychrobium sp. 1_MG-2023 TaxID=3062624 RepID=UPI000C330E24|nr:YiiD C-terminal domain-containing protein [Psychrobium sp. 1_MG-2023]MDP2560384.1 YiiD C-terminal domain-containing protein [Psychrobium sp. 1_MG-2023]PKF57947.1 hypothetical protein CW748_05345 [Alteromonadales bacterium alter-6D02]
MQLTWQTVPSDNMLLCQFMVNYELRQGQYIVAFNEQEQIVAAGILFQQHDHEAQVDVVVTEASRGQGVGRALVKRLMKQASDDEFERLTAHSANGFWQALGFSQVGVDAFACILPQAVKRLVSTWHEGIPLTEFMGLDISQATKKHVTTSANMKNCINVHQSMFAGAIYSQAVLTGWGLIHLRLQCSGLSGSIVLATGEIKYRQPIVSDPKGEVDHLIEMSSLLPLSKGEKVSIELSVNMHSGDSDQAGAVFNGRYVILPKTK